MKTTGGVVLANAAKAMSGVGPEEKGGPPGPVRVLALHDDAFPSVDAVSIAGDELRAACKDYSLTRTDAAGLAAALSRTESHILITMHGSAFPAEAFPSILSFLESGGCWINLGGVPLAVPVSRLLGAWKAESPQTAYHKKLGITQSFPVTRPAGAHLVPAGPFESASDLPDQCAVEESYALYLRLTDSKEFEDEDGSEGYREAKLYPLLHMVNADDLPIAAPVVLVDRLYERGKGGRWIFANYRGRIGADGLRSLLRLASFGAVDVTARPSFAAFRDDELPSISVSIRLPGRNPDGYLRKDPLVQVFDQDGQSVLKRRIGCRARGQVLAGFVDFSRRERARLPHGRYTVTVTASLRHPSTRETEEVRYDTGFWLYTPAMLAGGPKLTVDAHHFSKDGEPFPVTGTTYMSSESHRRFLLDPNPFLWNRDFAAMAAAGTNMIRTGIWTGWKHYMYDAGLSNDAALRAMDAFLLTARAHDIVVVFTFFAFLPERWGFDNPYLDPGAVRMQQEFISLFAHRYAAMNDIVWDLINEPSFCSPKALWTTRPNYDRHEAEAWNEWLRDPPDRHERHPAPPSLPERYRSTGEEPAALPQPADFTDANIFNNARPVKAGDYRRFAQDMFIRWLGHMTEAIRANGNPAQLITVGQDEGGTYERPSQQLYARAVDFTCMHNWWFNDDLIWDLVVTTNPVRANLVEETGVMFYERIDGGAWRTEEEVRDLLLRKLAVSVAGSAGYIQWNWSVNPYIRSDNEVAIGLFRVDGTAKPEFEAYAGMSAFIRRVRGVFQGKEYPDITIVLPQSCLYSVRNHATESTRRAVRTLFHECGLTANTVSEYRLSDIPTATRLIILPSARVITDRAWEELLERVRDGATLLLTGPIESDEHWLPAARLGAIGLSYSIRGVMNEEFCEIDGTEYLLAFRGEKVQRVEKAVVMPGTAPRVLRIPQRHGSILWCPLPVELSDRTEALTALYTYAAGLAGCRRLYTSTQRSPALVVLPAVFRDAVLYALVSETDRELEARFTHAETSTSFAERVPARQAVLLVIDRHSGALIARHDTGAPARTK